MASEYIIQVGIMNMLKKNKLFKRNLIILSIIVLVVIILNIGNIIRYVAVNFGDYNILSEDESVLIKYNISQNKSLEVDIKGNVGEGSVISCSEVVSSNKEVVIFQIEFQNSLLSKKSQISANIMENKKGKKRFRSGPINVVVTSSDGKEILYESVSNEGTTFPNSTIMIKISKEELIDVEEINIEIFNLFLFEV